MNKNNKEKEMNISITFNKDGECFQDIIERILINQIIKK